jgi:hypothetical protein
MKKPIILSVLFFILTAIPSFGQVSINAFENLEDRVLGKFEETNENHYQLKLRVEQLEKDNNNGNNFDGRALERDVVILESRVSNAELTASSINTRVSSINEDLKDSIRGLSNRAFDLERETGKNKSSIEKIQEKNRSN